jgi:hypothetical protein
MSNSLLSRKRVFVLLAVFVGIIGAFMLLVNFAFWQMNNLGTPAFRAFDATSQVEDFVLQNNRWPISWSELGLDPEKYEPHIIVRFDVSIKELADDPDLLKSDVTPKVDEWIILSEHSFQSQLHELRRAVEDAHRHHTNDSQSPDRGKTIH